MNNNDQFQAAMNEKNYIHAAKLAIEFGRGKSSKSGAWSWADDAIAAAKEAGIELNPGNLSWPDFEAMEKQLS